MSRNQYRGLRNRKDRKKLHTTRGEHERKKMESMFNAGIEIHTWDNIIDKIANDYVLVEFRLKKPIKYDEFLALLIASVSNGELKEYVR